MTSIIVVCPTCHEIQTERADSLDRCVACYGPLTAASTVAVRELGNIKVNGAIFTEDGGAWLGDQRNAKRRAIT